MRTRRQNTTIHMVSPSFFVFSLPLLLARSLAVPFNIKIFAFAFFNIPFRNALDPAVNFHFTKFDRLFFVRCVFVCAFQTARSQAEIYVFQYFLYFHVRNGANCVCVWAAFWKLIVRRTRVSPITSFVEKAVLHKFTWQALCCVAMAKAATDVFNSAQALAFSTLNPEMNVNF